MKKIDTIEPETPMAKRGKLITPVLWVFLFAWVLANLGGAMFNPLLPLYLKSLKAGISEIGLYFTLSMIIPLALQIIGGWLSDRIGRLRAIAIGSVGGTIGWAGIIVAPSWGWLLVCQSVGAIALAFSAPSISAFIAEQSEEKNRAKVFAITQSVMQIITIIGPLTGGLLVRYKGWKFLIIIATLLYFIATIIRILMARRLNQVPDNGERASIRHFGTSFKTVIGMVASGGLITWLLLSSGVKDSARGFSMSLLPVFLQEMRGINVAAIGLMHSISGIATMLVMIPAGHLADKYGERYLIAGGYLVGFFAFALMLLVPTPWAVGVSFGIFGAAMGLLQPAYQSLICKAVPNHMRGIVFGVLSTNSGIISLPAPWIGAMLWKGISPAAPFWVTGIAMLFMAPLVFLKLKLRKNVRN